MSADCRSRAATRASSFDSSSRPTFFHRMFAAFGDQELGRDQFRSLAKPQGLRRPVFVDNPFDRDAGLNNERLYRSSRPSRSRISDSVCFRRFVSSRKSAASLSKEGSCSPASAWRRGGSPLQFGDQPIVQVAHVQASSHQLLYESIANNDLISRAAGSRNDITRSRLG